MKTKILLLLSLVLTLGACDDDDKCKTILLPVNKIEATVKADLSQRKDWKFMIKNGISGTAEYKYTVDGNKITAVPRSEKETFHHQEYIGECNLLAIAALTYFQLVSPANSSTENSPQLDQRTTDKLFATDILRFETANIQVEYAVDLVYVFDLLEYNFIDLPEGAGVQLMFGDKDECKPYLHEGVYKAFAMDYRHASLKLTIGEAISTVPLKSLIQDKPYGEATHHTFTLRYHKDETDLIKVLTIENHTAVDRNK